MFLTSSLLEEILQKTLYMSSRLIRFYPRYASLGAIKAQIYLKQFMQFHKWDQVCLEQYEAKDIEDYGSYVRVSAFGDIYSRYEDFKKYNLLALIDSGKAGPNLILNGHVDVDIVDETVACERKSWWCSGCIESKKLFGRGAADMLSGLSALVHIAEYMNSNKDRWCGKIILKSVMDEELGGNGTLSSIFQLKKKNWINDNEYTECVIAEPTENKLCTSSLGFLHLIFYFSGTPMHMGVAQRNNNSLNNAAELINKFDTIIETTLKKMKLSHLRNMHKYNFGIINGGIDSAIPIASLKLEGTIFYPEETKKELFLECLSSTIQQFCKKNILISEGEFSFTGATFDKTIFGRKGAIDYSVFPSPCDARLYKEVGIPTTIFGPGSLSQAHSINEYIEIKSIKEYINALVKYILLFLKRYD